MVGNLQRLDWLPALPTSLPRRSISAVDSFFFETKELALTYMYSSSARYGGLLLLLASVLSGTPRLSLDQTSFSVLVAPGSNGTTQVANAYNIGASGTLDLSVSSNMSWLVPTVEKATTCGLHGGCTPIQLALNTASLANGSYTGVVTVTDSSAIDAPQNITVTVAVGGSVPSQLEFYLAPGGTVSTSFATGANAKASVSANTPWLAATVQKGGGATVTLTAASSMAANAYNGTITISNSSFPPDNKQIAVVLNVTTQPILETSSTALNFQIAQGANKQTATLAAINSGQGMLTVSSVTAAATSSGTWLSAATVTGGFTVTADPTGLAPNVYTGTVTVASNAANASVVIPVQLTVEQSTPPVAYAGGVVNNGTFASGEALAQGDIVAVFGDQFTYGDPAQAGSLPLQNTLGTVQVLVNGSAAPLYYVSPGQINFEIPIDAATGDGTVQIVRNSQPGNQAYINIAPRAPRFLLLNGGPYAILTTPQGALTGIPGSPVAAGDVVVIYTIGLGPTSPPVSSGTASPSSPLAEIKVPTSVCFGTPTPFFTPPCATPQFVGLTPGFVGLYQVNVQIPSGLKSGTTALTLTVDNVASDVVQLPVQ